MANGTALNASRPALWLSVLHYALAAVSIVLSVVGWFRVDPGFVGEVLWGTSEIVVTDSRGIDRMVQTPVLLVYSFAILSAFAIVTGSGLLRRRRWAWQSAFLTPVVSSPFWVVVTWLIARHIVLHRFGHTSTDPAFAGHVTPMADLGRAAVITTGLWGVAALVYWCLVRREGIRSDFARVPGSPARMLWTVLAGLGVSCVLVYSLVNFRLSDGRMLIHDAAAHGWTDAVAALLRLGNNADVRAVDGRTPLHFAADSGRLDVAKYLLDHGASIDSVDGQGLSPVAAAALGGYSLWDGYNRDCEKTVILLLARGADVKLPASRVVEGVACSPNYPRVLVRKLIEHGMPVNATYCQGHTLLSDACERGGPEDIDYLLASGAHMYPFVACVASPGNLAHLLKRGLDVHARDEDGMTALDYALEHDVMGSPGDGRISVKLLVQRGAKRGSGRQ